MVHAACCMLHAACCTPHVARCVVACCMLHIVNYMVRDACRMMHAACCSLRGCMLHAACYMLHDACRMRHVARCVLHVVLRPVRAVLSLYGRDVVLHIARARRPTRSSALARARNLQVDLLRGARRVLGQDVEAQRLQPKPLPRIESAASAWQRALINRESSLQSDQTGEGMGLPK
jgi:hypothetical protein